MATSKLTTTTLDFTSNGTDINARLTASDDIITFFGTSGAGNEILLKNLRNPVDAQDAATRGYVDNLVTSGITWKDASNAATTANIADLLTGAPDTVDGVTMVVGYRVVVKNQSTASENGIYEVTTVGTGADGVWARAADAAAGTQANGTASFVIAGTSNNDKTFVVNNDTIGNWGTLAVTWIVMSVAPATAVAGTDTQVQFNSGGVLGADAGFTYNKTATVPVMTIGTTATGTSTITIGATGQAKNITATGTGLMTVGSAGGATTVNSTSGALTLQSVTSGDVVVTSAGGFTGTGAVGSNIALFNTTTTGTISSGAALTTGTLTLGNATAGTGTITIDGDSSIINVGPTTTGAVNIGSTAAGAVAVNGASTMTVAADSTSVTIGSVANSTSTTMTGQDVNVGTATTTTTDVNGISVDVGSTVTTSLDLLATGVSGAVVVTAGDVTGSGTVSISTTSATTATVAGGEIDLTAGNGNTTGAGGAVDINAGFGGVDGSGGAVIITAGNGGSSTGNGGNVFIDGGDATGAIGTGGSITLQPGVQAGGSGGSVIVLKLASAGVSSTDNIIQFQSSAGAELGRMEANGEMYATAFNTTSDVRYKTNISGLDDPLAQINKIEGYSYHWKKEYVGRTDKLQYGVIAQQLESVGLGHLVAGSEESKAVNYLGLIPLLIEAVKELSAKLDTKENIKDITKESTRKVSRVRKL